MQHSRSSRQRYRAFVEDYRRRRLDDASRDAKPAAGKPPAETRRKRRQYLREYVRWLRPHGYAVGALIVLALVAAGLDMASPLFMRYIIDRVLLNPRLDAAARLRLLNGAGAVFLGVVFASNLVSALREYRQRLVNNRITISLRRALFDRLLHLPLPKLWDMKTGGILSRISGDVDTTTGLLQMADLSPLVSVIRLVVAFGILMALNWRLALTALAIVPGIMAISFIFAKRVRPIYRSVRKDAEEIDGRVGETFSGIRVVRAFRREVNELLDFLRGRHTVLRKEMFAQRREMVIWTSWNLLMGVVNVAIVWYGGYLNLRGGASIGDIMAFQWYTLPAAEPGVEHRQLVFRVAALAGGHGARVRNPGNGGRQARPARTPSTRPRVVQEIRFEDVEFEYREGRPVVRDFSVTVPGGSVVALVGRSGAGKTTVTDLVARFHDPTQGPHPAQRRRHSRFPPAILSRPAGDRAAGRVPVRRIGARQHRLRPARRHGRRRSKTPRAAPTRTSSSRSFPNSTRRSSASAA